MANSLKNRRISSVLNMSPKVDQLFILTVSLGTINHCLVYSNLKISTGAAIWANIYTFM